MFTKNSCAILMLAVVSAVSWNAAVSGQEVGRSRHLKPKVTVRQVQTKSGTIVVHDHRGEKPSGTTIRDGVRVPPPRRQPTSGRRRISVSELRKRVNALENGQQSGARKANTKPTPQNNPELQSICDQLIAVMELINSEMDYLLRRGGSVEDAEFIELKLLFNKAARVYLRHGCRGTSLTLKPQIQVKEGPFKVLK